MVEKTGSEDNESSNTYFAAEEPKKAAATLNQKAQSWFNTLSQNNYLEKLRRSWMAYHGAYYSDAGSGHSIVFEGEQGELVNIPVNHYRNIAQHILVMITSARPAFQARSTNKDYKSLVQTNLASGLLEYYMREKRLEKVIKRAVEYAITLGSGYIKLGWNATEGQVYDYNEELGIPIYDGDIEFTNLSPWDVVFDTSKETVDNDWVIVRSYKNKYDLAAKYPELGTEIKALQTKTEISNHRFLTSAFDESVDIPIYEFFHKRSEALPEGRYMLYADEDVILADSPLPYRDIPVYRISPGDILGSPYGYTPMFDLIPIQDMVNSLYSTIATNQAAFGVQNIYVPRGADIAVNQLAGGLNIIEGNPGAGKPEPLNLTQTPAEVFRFVESLVKTMETLSGVNSVARGNPEKNLESGNALALIQSQALQFMSGLQHEYIHMIEDVGTGIINLLRDFASTPRVAAIAGKGHKSQMKEFTGDDLDTVNRVVVDVGNALANTTSGKLQMAENLLQMFGDKLPVEQYFNILNTGRLDVMTDGINKQVLLVHDENEKLVDGSTEVLAIATDCHSLHINHHKDVLGDSELRHDEELVARTLAHISEHINLLRTTDPDMLVMTKQQPLTPQGGPPIGPDGKPQPPPQGGMPPQANPEAGGPPAGPNPNAALPQPAKPPQVQDERPLPGGLQPL